MSEPRENNYKISAETYDSFFSWKDYRAEAERIAGLVKTLHSRGRTLLDLACGTGEHLRGFAEAFEADGLDLNPDFIQRAQAKLPNSNFYCSDMTCFALPKRYDVMTCLFGSVAYCLTDEGLSALIGAAKAHLREEGVFLIEPWFQPSQWQPEGRIYSDLVRRDQRHVCAMNIGRTLGRIAVSEYCWMVAEEGRIEMHREVHRQGLYTHEDIVVLMRQHGFQTDLHPGFEDGHPLIIGRQSHSEDIPARTASA